MGIYGIYDAISMINEGKDYAEYETEEQCLITAREAKTCGHAEVYQYKYAYEAIVPSKCGNATLFSSERDDGECPGELKDIGFEYRCHVLDCDEEEFSFHNGTTRVKWGKVLLICAIIVLFLPCVYFLYLRTCGDNCNKFCKCCDE